MTAKSNFEIPDGPWYERDKWFSSPYSFEKSVVEKLTLPKRVMVRDVTLSEGNHAIGSNYTLEGMLRIAALLDEARIPEIKQHYGDYYTLEFIRAFKEQGNHRARVSAMVPIRAGVERRVRESRLDSVIDAEPDEIEILAHNPSEDGVTALESIEYVKKSGIKLSIGIPNSVRIPFRDVADFYLACEPSNPEKFALYESYDCISVEGVKFFIERVRHELTKDKVPILWQSHNDLGLGTATSLAAIAAGATFVDLSVNALGDRSGNAATEEVCLALEMLYGISTGVDLSKLYELSRLVIKESTVPIQPYKAVVGESQFLHEAEPHARMILEGGLDTKYIPRGEPYAPSIVGRSRDVRIGGTSLGLIPMRIKMLGLNCSKDDEERVREHVSEVWTKERRDMSLEEFDDFVRKTVGVQRG